jgi:hypothetical protein
MAAATKGAKGAVERREQLEVEQVNLVDARDAAAARVAELAERIAEHDRSAAAQRVGAARSGQPTPGVVDQERVQLAVEHEQARASVAELSAAVAKVPAEVAELHRREWPAFAADAEQHAARAREALAALETAYRAAHDQWETAREAWTTVLSDLDEREDTGGAATAVRAGSGLRSVPAFPLAPPAEAFASVDRAPRPRGLLTDEQARLQGRPGSYRDVMSGSVQEMGDARSVRSHAHLVTPDARGFVRYHRVGEIS